MPPRISQLQMTCFRGATKKSSIKFDDKKPIVFLFGENGAGKSTIVDAIDLVTNGSIGSLEKRSVGVSNKTVFLPSVGKALAALSVQLELEGKTWTATVDETGVKTHLEADVPTVKILRRADLLQLVEAAPAQRYKALESFLDVAPIEKCEKALRDLEKSVKQDLDAIAKTLADATNSLETFWKLEGSLGDNAEAWAAAKKAVDQTDLEKQEADLDVAMTRLREVEGKVPSFSAALESLTQACALLSEADSSISSAPPIAGQDAVSVVQILQSARAFLDTASDVDRCPLCEQPVVQDDLKVAIATRLGLMTVHTALAQKQDAAKLSVAHAEGAWKSAVDVLGDAIQQAIDSEEVTGLPADVYPQKLKPARDAIEAAPKEATDTVMGLDDELSGVIEKVNARLASVRSDKEKYNGIVTSLTRMNDNRAKAQSLAALVKALKKALSIYEKERKAFTQEVLDEVSDEIGLLFDRIHPDEPLGDPRLKLTRRASIEQSASFGSKTGVPPQAYYSDSHLDTFGLCVWLALAKRGNISETIIVLDDLFSSIDAAHHRRVLQLLVDEADTFAQTIITTHSRTLFNRPRKMDAASSKMDMKELHRWSFSRGVAATTRSIYADEIKAKLEENPLPRQEISSQAGILLESVLDDLAEQYERPLPRNRANEYTLGALLDGCAKAMKLLDRRVDGVPAHVPDGADSPVLTAFKKLRSLDFIRNQVGCHHNTCGDEIADAEVEAFGRATVELVSEVTCPYCREVPARRDGTHFCCTCKKSQLYPLEV